MQTRKRQKRKTAKDGKKTGGGKQGSLPSGFEKGKQEGNDGKTGLFLVQKKSMKVAKRWGMVMVTHKGAREKWIMVQRAASFLGASSPTLPPSENGKGTK